MRAFDDLGPSMNDPSWRPLVSMVTPTYNQADYLAQTIDSVLAQDYPHIEYLVLDDGSTDSTPEVLHRYDGKVTWERQTNMGQSATLNKGWTQSKGQYLGYISSDDRLLPHAISTLVATLERHPEAVVAYCDFDLIDEKGVVVGHEASPEFKLSDLVGDLVCQPGAGALFRRDAFEKVGGWNPRLRKIPDFEFWLRMSKVGPFVRVPETLAEYRVHADSTAIRPLPVERTMEIVNTMRDYWGTSRSPEMRYSMSRAHFKAARHHAMSGRYVATLAQFAQAVRYRPKTLVSLSSWRSIFSGFALRLVSRSGRLGSMFR